MLKLRRGQVVSADPLRVRLDGSLEGAERSAWADPVLVGECRAGDEVVVNTEALDLGLGSGGFDLVCANLTRGLEGPGSATDHVMKLNYSPLQHPVATVERRAGEQGELPPPADPVPVLAIGLHGHLAPVAWAATKGSGPARIGYVQTAGGALPGKFSRDVETLLERGLLAGHVTAGPSYGGGGEAITLIGALDAASGMGWDAVIAGPGPGILGSETAYGHGGMAALDVLHAALSLDLPAILAPRLSGADPRPRHRGLSHHSHAVLHLCLAGVEVPLPESAERMLGPSAPEEGFEQLISGIGKGEHRVVRQPADLAGYLESGLPHRSMGRELGQDPAFFAGPLAAGQYLSGLI